MLEKLTSHSIDASFLKQSFEWFQDESFRKLTLTSPVSRAKQMEWYQSLPDREDYKLWGVKLEQEWVGAFGLKHINLNCHKAEYWGYIGNSAARGKGIGRWMLGQAILQAKVCNIQVLYLKVWKDNVVALKLYSKMGFCKVSAEDEVVLMEKQIGEDIDEN